MFSFSGSPIFWTCVLIGLCYRIYALNVKCLESSESFDNCSVNHSPSGYESFNHCYFCYDNSSNYHSCNGVSLGGDNCTCSGCDSDDTITTTGETQSSLSSSSSTTEGLADTNTLSSVMSSTATDTSNTLSIILLSSSETATRSGGIGGSSEDTDKFMTTSKSKKHERSLQNDLIVIMIAAVICILFILIVIGFIYSKKSEKETLSEYIIHKLTQKKQIPKQQYKNDVPNSPTTSAAEMINDCIETRVHNIQNITAFVEDADTDPDIDDDDDDIDDNAITTAGNMKNNCEGNNDLEIDVNDDIGSKTIKNDSDCEGNNNNEANDLISIIPNAIDEHHTPQNADEFVVVGNDDTVNTGEL